jgi:hypothetical protein
MSGGAGLVKLCVCTKPVLVSPGGSLRKDNARADVQRNKLSDLSPTQFKATANELLPRRNDRSSTPSSNGTKNHAPPGRNYWRDPDIRNHPKGGVIHRDHFSIPDRSDPLRSGTPDCDGALSHSWNLGTQLGAGLVLCHEESLPISTAGDIPRW